MRILSIGGSFDSISQNGLSSNWRYMHDASAVLVENGKVIAAVEEERFNRIKHTNKLPAQSIRFCLSQAGINISDVDYWAWASLPESFNSICADRYLDNPLDRKAPNLIEYLTSAIHQEFQYQISPERICFVPHHLAHAVSAFELSGFDSALAITYDAGGDIDSGRVYSVENGIYTLIGSFDHPVGQYYIAGTKLLGYRNFDEYKVMGLAPYGDPDRYRDLLTRLYRLLPNGQFAINDQAIYEIAAIFPPRRKGDPFTQEHKDFAAAVQEGLERICWHIVSHFKNETSHKNLCLAGGVALNCTFNGKLVQSNLFERVFVQPASHDAGADLGAALWVWKEKSKGQSCSPMTNLFWGPSCGSDSEIESILQKWSSLIDFRKSEDIAREAAQLISNDKAIGWVQGRSEFAHRALGNRSILADPRPAANKTRINAMVKKREAYRPFAPSVLSEKAGDYFEISSNKSCYDYMVCNATVRPEFRSILGAVTHVDGSARVQTVTESSNPLYWSLIKKFGDLTGVHVLLNTSFNNNVEPIVNTAEEAVVCYLTTELDYLVIGNYIVSRKAVDQLVAPDMVIRLPARFHLKHQKSETSDRDNSWYGLEPNFGNGSSVQVSERVFRMLMISDGILTIAELGQTQLGLAQLDADLFYELSELWHDRYIELTPQC